MKEEFDIPQELEDIMIERDAYTQVRNRYAALPFGYKKAVRASIKAEKLRDDFWGKVYKLYPNLRGADLSHNPGTGTVIKLNKEGNQ